jgi:hypothetical protein
MSRTVKEPDQYLIADALRDDLEAMEKDMQTLSLTEAMLMRLRASFAGAVESARAVAEHLQRRKLDSFRDEVRRQPATACAISMLLGILFAAAFMRR